MSLHYLISRGDGMIGRRKTFVRAYAIYCGIFECFVRSSKDHCCTCCEKYDTCDSRCQNNPEKCACVLPADYQETLQALRCPE